MHLAAGSTGREVVGIDIDEAKLVTARQAAGSDPPLANVTFASAARLDGLGHFDAVTVVDVLYLLTAEGLEVTDRRRPYPHHLVMGSAPAAKAP